MFGVYEASVYSVELRGGNVYEAGVEYGRGGVVYEDSYGVQCSLCMYSKMTYGSGVCEFCVCECFIILIGSGVVMWSNEGEA